MSEVIRTDAIQGDIVHEYDGIEEADNKLPNWWLATFYVAIVFAVCYWLWFHALTAGTSPLEAYEQERTRRLEAGGEVTEPMLVDLAQQPVTVAEGRALFEKNCVTCHGPEAGGNIGPNLTDEYWLRGGAPLDIYNTVFNGTDAGMLSWGPRLGKGRVKQVVAYVLSIRNTHVPGKAPQGEEYTAAAPDDGGDDGTTEDGHVEDR